MKKRETVLCILNYIVGILIILLWREASGKQASKYNTAEEAEAWNSHCMKNTWIRSCVFPYTVFVCLYMEIVCPNTVKYGTVFRRFSRCVIWNNLSNWWHNHLEKSRTHLLEFTKKSQRNHKEITEISTKIRNHVHIFSEWYPSGQTVCFHNILFVYLNGKSNSYCPFL